MSQRSGRSDPLLTAASLLLGIGVLLVMVRAALPGLVLCVVGVAIYAARRGGGAGTASRSPSGPQDLVRGGSMPVIGGPVALADPFTGPPVNELPAQPHVLLPPGPGLPVRGVAVHADLLAPYAQSGGHTWVAVSLTDDDEGGLAVRLGGERIGHLGSEAAEELRPLVHHVGERGLIPVGAATVRGSALTTEVVLHCARARDVEDAWLRGLPGVPP